MSTDERVKQMRTAHAELLRLFVRKNTDYGDSFAEHGPVGVLIRMGDKLKRLVSITRTGVTLVDDEGVRDTLLDLANYATMAVMLLDEERAAGVTPPASR